MLQFAANLSMMYNEFAFPDRFAAAARAGFTGVEYLFPYEWPADLLQQKLLENGLTQVLFNAPPGDWAAGERGLASLPERKGEFQEGFGRAIEYARTLGCKQVHVMAGLVAAGTMPETAHGSYVENLGWAADQAAPHGIDVLMEPINGRDMPGYFLNRQGQAHAIAEELGRANLKVQMDLYHCQIAEGDVTMRIRQYLGPGRSRVAHLQVASVPARNEPDGGELHYPWLFQVLEELGYDGWIGCEYRPRAGTDDGLGWFQPYRTEK